MPFPIPFLPKLGYRTGARYFGARRPRDRKHAGCDLICAEGTPVFAVEDGVIVEASQKEFYTHVYAVAVQHIGFVARYCEVQKPSGLRPGMPVKAGQVIAHVGKMKIDSMLHFELYADLYGPGHLTVRGNPPYQRRADLIDPTGLLDLFNHDFAKVPSNNA
jgi:murein DD-endopeptidase MepM/ murein hydrolase activator NlpD